MPLPAIGAIIGKVAGVAAKLKASKVGSVVTKLGGVDNIKNSVQAIGKLVKRKGSSTVPTETFSQLTVAGGGGMPQTSMPPIFGRGMNGNGEKRPFPIVPVLIGGLVLLVALTKGGRK